jgi:hypothetical protein
MNCLHWDFETRSSVDLEEVGMENYIRHPSTKPVLCGWARNDDPVNMWQCLREPMPDRLLATIKDESCVLAAW